MLPNIQTHRVLNITSRSLNVTECVKSLTNFCSEHKKATSRLRKNFQLLSTSYYLLFYLIRPLRLDMVHRGKFEPICRKCTVADKRFICNTLATYTFPWKMWYRKKYIENIEKNIELRVEGWTKINYENLNFSRITYVLESVEM